MGDPRQELEHLGKLAAADSVKRYDRLYKLVRNPRLIALAAERVRQNTGGRSAGIDGQTRAQIDEDLLRELIDDLAQDRYQPKAVRRAYIPKGKKGRRALGIPTVRDRIVQAAVAEVLEAIYEPIFRPCSYGFRPRRSPIHALRQLAQAYRAGATWTIEGDLVHCFDAIPHGVILACLRKRIKDERFIDLIRKMLQAGVIEDGCYERTYSGTPQGGLASPILSNVVLHEFDCWMEDHWQANPPPLTKQQQEARTNPEYARHKRNLVRWRAQLAGRIPLGRQTPEGLRTKIQAALAARKQVPSVLPRRMISYCRYADDVRHITRRQIPFTERRGSEDVTSGSTADLAAKAKGDSSMPVKRDRLEDAYGLVPQDPRDMVKAPLPEPQSPAMQAYILRSQRLRRSQPDRAAKSSSPEASAGWAVAHDATQGDGQGTYVALDTSGTEGMWDRPPRREAQGDGAAVVLRGRESRLHGEGRQVL